MINVVLADHQAIFCAGTARVLALEDDIRIVAQPRTSERLLHSAACFRPHVIVSSTAFLHASKELIGLASSHRIALLLIAERGDEVSEFVNLGFPGVIYRSADPETVVSAVRRLARGEKFIQTTYGRRSQVVPDTTATSIHERLTKAELRIIRAIMCGFRNREIGLQIGANEHAVKNKLRLVFDKLGVSDRLELSFFVLSQPKLAQVIAQQANATPLRGRSSHTTRADSGLAN